MSFMYRSIYICNVNHKRKVYTLIREKNRKVNSLKCTECELLGSVITPVGAACVNIGRKSLSRGLQDWISGCYTYPAFTRKAYIRYLLVSRDFLTTRDRVNYNYACFLVMHVNTRTQQSLTQSTYFFCILK